MPNRLRVLLVDDDKEEYMLVRDLLIDHNRAADAPGGMSFALDWVADFDTARQLLAEKRHDIYLCDYHLGAHNGVELLTEARRLGVQVPIILMTGRGSYELDVLAMQEGATDYLPKADLTGPLLERTIRYALERQRTAARLVESEAHLRLGLQAAHMGAWDLDAATGAFTASQELANLLGVPPENSPTTLGEFLERVDQRDRQQVRRAFQEALTQSAGDASAEIEFRILGPQGRRCWLHSRGKLMADAAGRPRRLMGVMLDVTDRRRAEERVRQQAHRSDLLARLTQDFAEASLNYAGIYATIADRLAEVSQDLCILGRLDDSGAWLELAACADVDPKICQQVTAALEGLRQPAPADGAGAIYLEGHTFRLGADLTPVIRARAPATYWSLLEKLHASSAVLVPLRARGRTIGTLGMIRRGPQRPYRADDVRFFQEVADRAALAIENARLFSAEQARALELAALQKATAALLTTIDLNDLLSHILDVAQSAIPASQKGLLYLLAPETGSLQLRAISGVRDARIHRIRLPRQNFSSERLLERQQPQLFADLWQEPPETNLDLPPEVRDMRSGVIAPLVLNETVLGVLGLVSSAPHAFTPADLRLLESFAHTTTAAIQNATLHNEVQMLAVTDTLTETYNRRGFFEVCQREFERAVRFNRPLAVIMLDLDGFKSVNDTYGHAAGDQALRVLAQRLFTSIREHDYLGRYGGDEFTILLPESDLETASVIAERMRRSLNKPFSLIGSGSEPVTLAMTASLGVADRLGEADFQQLIDRADRAAYTAKRAGGNRVNTG